VDAIERELFMLRQGEIALLMKQAEEKQRDGGDLLEELEKSVREQIDAMRKEYETIATQEARPA
jgi:hypothetical protein